MAEALSILVGVGLFAFWGVVLGRGELRAGPDPWPGHLRHERCFLVPDLVVAVALIGSVVLPTPVSESLRLLAAGGLIFLGLLDFGYLAQTWQFRTQAQRVRTAVTSTVASLAGIALAVL